MAHFYGVKNLGLYTFTCIFLPFGQWGKIVGFFGNLPHDFHFDGVNHFTPLIIFRWGKIFGVGVNHFTPLKIFRWGKIIFDGENESSFEYLNMNESSYQSSQ